MHHAQHSAFVQAIHDLRQIRLRFWSKEDHGELVRLCAPFDFGPSRRARDKTPRYHFWDYDSDTGSHSLSLPADQIIAFQLLEARFNPADLITWDLTKSPWFLTRNWGAFS